MNNFKMHSNFIKNKEKKENEDSVRNKKINLRPIDHIFNIRDEDSITNKSIIKSLERKNLTKEKKFIMNCLIYGIHLEL